jgi:adenylate kinase
MALNLIMLGPPGAGKGTQAERFARSAGIPKISTGDILRGAVHDDTELGRHAKAIMDRGELVGDDVVIGIVRERLDRPDARPGFILDGFPRTVAQAQALDGIMTGRSALIVVDIVVPESDLIRRLSARLVCSDCGSTATPSDVGVSMRCVKCGGPLQQRADDNESVVRERLAVYRRNTEPLVAYYRSRPTFCSIDGAQASDRVADDIAAAVRTAAGVMEGSAR